MTFFPVAHAGLNVLVVQACGLYYIHQCMDAMNPQHGSYKNLYCIVPLQFCSCDCI